jgi:hypothetical protein
VLRLSSKSHWDLPVRIGRSTVDFTSRTRRGAPQRALRDRRGQQLRPGRRRQRARLDAAPARGAARDRPAAEQGGANLTQRGDPFLDTADFNDQAPGNLRADYVLPSHGLVPRRGEVFWPTCDSPLARLNDASDHHLVRQDIAIPGR